VVFDSSLEASEPCYREITGVVGGKAALLPHGILESEYVCPHGTYSHMLINLKPSAGLHVSIRYIR